MLMRMKGLAFRSKVKIEMEDGTRLAKENHSEEDGEKLLNGRIPIL